MFYLTTVFVMKVLVYINIKYISTSRLPVNKVINLGLWTYSTTCDIIITRKPKFEIDGNKQLMNVSYALWFGGHVALI